MKKMLSIYLLLAMSTLTVCGQGNNSDNNTQDRELPNGTMYLHIGGRTLSATLVDNSATKRLKELLAQNSIIVNMSDYGGFEKVGSLGASLPRNDTQTTTSSGDIILYNGNQLVIFYGSNSWSYTRLGKIDNSTQQELRSILGSGNVTVTLSLSQ